MARVFVSHAGSDAELAAEVFDWLVGVGHEVFYDRDLSAGLTVGVPWEQRLYERLRWADAMVCLVTTAYVASAWCSAEVGFAVSRGTRLLPVVGERGAAHPLLQGIQHANYAADSAVATAGLLEALTQLDNAGGSGWPDGRSPFPGLRAFDSDMHGVYFGRRIETTRLAQLLRSPAESGDSGVLVVTGPSGCGKSSLVRAGLLPVMADEPGWWTLPAVRPGADPVGALAGEIVRQAGRLELPWTLPQIRARLTAHPAQLFEDLLLATPGNDRRRLLVVFDQFEELLTRSPSAERAGFARMLAGALDGPILVVATLRPEYLAPLLANPMLAGVPIRTFAVRPLPPEALPHIIAGPAELAGINVDPELIIRLVTDTGSGEALPLLAFTLQQLAADVTRGGHLSVTQYELLGGVQGALTTQADAALADARAATGRTDEQVIAGLLRLVTVDEQGRPARTRTPVAGLPDEVRTEMNAFTARRLLTTDVENDAVVIGVTHEAFLTAWPPLATAITNTATALRTRRAVEHGAAQWENANRDPRRLWERGQLAAALTDLQAMASSTSAWQRLRPWRRRATGPVQTAVQLSDRATTFLTASIRTDRRRRARGTTVLSLLLAGALMAATIAYLQQQTAQQEKAAALDQQRLAVARELLGQANNAVKTDPRAALMLDVAAARIHPDQQSGVELIKTLATTSMIATVRGHTDSVRTVAFSPDGRTLVTGSADHTVILWDVADPTHPTPIGPPLTGHADTVRSVAFSPDGRTLVTGSADHTVILWDVADPTHPTPIGPPLTGHTDTVTAAAFSPDGRTLATGSADHTVILWDVADPTPTPIGPPLTDHTDSVRSVVFSPDGHTLATGSDDHTVRLWDVTDRAHPEHRFAPTGHNNVVLGVAFSPDGHTLATASGDNTIKLWDAADPIYPGLVASLDASTDLSSVAFSPDGRTLAAGTANHTVAVWDVTDRTHPRSTEEGDGELPGHTDVVFAVAFSPDGRTLASASADHTVILRDLTGSRGRAHLLHIEEGDPTPFAAAYSPDGRMLAIGNPKHTVILRDDGDPGHPAQLGPPLDAHTDNIYSVAFSPDGKTLVAGSADHTAILWNVADPAQPAQLGAPLTAHTGVVWSVALSPDGRTLATGSADRTVILWNVADPAHPTQLGRPLDAHTDQIYSVAFSPDGKTLATGSADHTAILWNVADPAHPTRLGSPLRAHAGPVWSVAFSPDAQTLATGSDDHTTILWDVADPAHPAQLGPPLTGHTAEVKRLAFTPDSHMLATAGYDGTTIVWDLTDTAAPIRLQTLAGGWFPGRMTALAISPDGHTLTTGSEFGELNTWNISGLQELHRNPLDQACDITGRGLNRDEWARYIPGLSYEDTCPG